MCVRGVLTGLQLRNLANNPSIVIHAFGACPIDKLRVKVVGRGIISLILVLIKASCYLGATASLG